MSGSERTPTSLYLLVSGYGFSKELTVIVPAVEGDWLRASGIATIELHSPLAGLTAKPIYKLCVSAVIDRKPNKTSKPKPKSKGKPKPTRA